ncbi:MAG: nitrite/sulfite reductase [Acidobacteria bacterium]|nr:nitrite/sulfite reductase [Acidobacteriota bacterium]
MPAVESISTLGRAHLGFSDPKDVDLFVTTLARFESGEISPEAWKSFRLLNGTYGQRQDGFQMLRVKLPQGILTAAQLEVVVHVARTYARGFAHVTTRQNFQFHFLQLADLETILRTFADAGITSKEACGNSVRTITGCPYAGVAADERFDVTPYADALTRFLLRHPLSSTLPRKFKIAFEGCAEDHAVAAINDLGFRAVLQDGRRGFRVTVGGGTGILPVSGPVLFEFLPAGGILEAAEAVLSVYHRLGDRENRAKNRIKFLIRSIGFAAFRTEVVDALAELTAKRRIPLPFDEANPPEESEPSGPRPSVGLAAAARASLAELRGPGLLPQLPRSRPSFEKFLATNVKAQRQAGYATVAVTLVLGDVTAPQLDLLAELSRAYGDGAVRLTTEQDLLFRWVRTDEVAALFDRLEAAGLGTPGAGTVTDVTSCPGAESCRLAVTHSRGLGRLLTDHLQDHPEVAALAPELKLKISGCPNGCGQHHIAGIGFQGSARQLSGKALPQYFVMTGGEVTEQGASFAKIVAKVPARRIPAAVDLLLGLYRDEGAPGETAPAFFRRIGGPRQKALLADLERLSAGEASDEDFTDLGQPVGEAFALETKEGECAR